MRVLALTKYGTLAASTRQRFIQYLPELNAAGVNVTFSPLFGNDYLARFARGVRRSWVSVAQSYIRRLIQLMNVGRFDILWIHCELLPYLPVEGIVRLIKQPIVYDYDDAIFHMYDASNLGLVRRLLGRKLEPLLRAASVCCCGNPYLRDYAEKFCRNTIVLPTVVDTDIYVPGPAPRNGGPPVIGWIGSPSTWRMMRPILPTVEPLVRQSLARVRVVGAGPVAQEDRFEGLEVVDWSEETEVSSVQSFDIGVMPLVDTPFERGKSGYKLIQYMACGLPVVASPVGVNTRIVRDGQNGFLATSETEWERSLLLLLRNASLRRELGDVGREIAVRDYSIRTHAPRLVEVFRAVDRMTV